jgi:hypothetical protein
VGSPGRRFGAAGKGRSLSRARAAEAAPVYRHGGKLVGVVTTLGVVVAFVVNQLY